MRGRVRRRLNTKHWDVSNQGSRTLRMATCISNEAARTPIAWFKARHMCFYWTVCVILYKPRLLFLECLTKAISLPLRDRKRHLFFVSLLLNLDSLCLLCTCMHVCVRVRVALRSWGAQQQSQLLKPPQPLGPRTSMASEKKRKIPRMTK